MRGSILGNNVKRVEDPRFVRGEGRYLDDIEVDDVLYLRSVRSPFAHGVLNGIDTGGALEIPGVVAVYTAEDIDLKDLPASGKIGRSAYRPLIARDRVRFVGEIVAIVVAESAVAAADAAERVWPDIDPLPAVTSIAAATAQDAPLLFEELGSNVVKAETEEEPDLFAGTDVVVSATYWNQRVAPVPLEPNSAMAIPDEDGRLTLWVGTQNVFGQRNTAARALGWERDQIRGRVPDMGGGFGAKFYSYPEQVLVAEVARRLGRPVKWLESRAENLTTMTHGRAQLHRVEIGARSDGTVVALRLGLDQDVGAYPTFGAVIPPFTGMMAPGPYRFSKLEFSYRDIVTNTMSIHAYRGAGRPEATALLERVMDMLADELEMDPAELRKMNFWRPDEFPVETAGDATYDSGDYAAALDLALETAGYDELRAEQRRRRDAGERIKLGIGISSYVEVTAGESGPQEWGAAGVGADGRITLRVGTSSHGQGHETAFTQLAAKLFKVPYGDIEVVFGDTDRLAHGRGTGGSRSLQLGGSALIGACDQVVEKARAIVAHLEEASLDDVVVLDGGRVGVAGVPDSGFTWRELAAIATNGDGLPPGMDPGLEADTLFEQGDSTFPFGSHVSVVEVDVETGDVTVLRHVAVDDAGIIVNRLLVDGQVHGGIAQGLGQALFEEMRYDETGNPLTGNLVSYILPMAPNLPSFEVAHTQTPTDLNPLGVKGIGEAATIGSTPAIQNAVIDALRPLGVRHIDMPLTPQRVWEAIRDAGG